MKTKYIIIWSKDFLRGLKALSDKHQKLVLSKLEMLSENPAHPALRSKKYKRRLGCYECSVNMDIRVLWRYGDGGIIVALKVGHHDILDK